MAETRQLTVKMAIQAADYRKQLKAINTQNKLLKSEFEALSESSEEFEDSLEGQGAKLKLLNGQLDNAKKKLSIYEKEVDKCEDTLNKATKAYEDQQEEIKSLEAQIKDYTAAYGKSSDVVKRMESSLEDLNKELQKKEKAVVNANDALQRMQINANNAQREVNQLERQAAECSQRLQDMENGVQELSNELNNIDGSSLEVFGDALDDINIGDLVGEIDGLGDGLDLVSMAAGGAGLALAGVITNSAINSAKDYDKALFDLRTGLGLTKKDAEETAKSLSEIATEGYETETLTEAYSMLRKVFKDMNESELQEMSKNISLLNDMGYETNETIQAVSKVMKAWGLTGNEAIGLIIKGEQEGLNIAGDWIETLGEYSPILAGMEIDAVSFFNMMVQGFDQSKSSSDHLADAFKEIGLQFTDGTDSLRDAFKEIGINYDSLKKQVDSGKITMPEAFSEITKALDGVKDATDRNRLAQAILAGTFEYTGTFAVDSNNKVIDSTKDLEGTVNDLNAAYDESYLKTQRELDGEWVKLKTTIGSAVLPILTEVISTFNNLAQQIGIGISNVVTHVQIMSNQIKAFFQEIGISMMETLVDNPVFEKLFPGMEERLATAKKSHEQTINYIQGKEQQLLDNQKALDDLYASSKEETYNKTVGIADTKTKEVTDVVNKNTNEARNVVKTNMDGMNSDIADSLSGLGNIAVDETGKIPQATQKNLSQSAKVIRQFGSDAYNGVRTSFTKLEQVSKKSFTNMYNEAKKRFVSMANVMRTQATNMRNIANNQFVSIKNIGTNQFKNLRDNVTSQMISMSKVVSTQWANIRNTLSKSINGKVNITRTTTTNEDAKNRSFKFDFKGVQNTLPSVLSSVNIDNIALSGSYYNSNTPSSNNLAKAANIVNNVSAPSVTVNQDDTNMVKVLDAYLSRFVQAIEGFNPNLQVNLDGKQLSNRLNKIDGNNMRLYERFNV